MDGDGGRAWWEVVHVLEEVEERVERRAVVDYGEEKKLKLHGKFNKQPR